MTNRCRASLGAAVIAMTVAWLSAADLAAQVAAGTAGPGIPGVTPANSNAATVRMTERFTRIDENTIEYNYTIDDPSTWTGHGLRSFR